MVKQNIYVEINTVTSAKPPHSVCGDIVRVDRSEAGTLCVVCDGQGSGISANLAAKMALSRLFELISSGFSVQQAFERVINTIQKARGNNNTYAAMTVIFIRPDGSAAILGYEAPPVIWISRRKNASIVETRTIRAGNALIQQASCFLDSGEALLAMSDGITQAGLGKDYPNGLTPEKITDIIELQLCNNPDLSYIAGIVHAQAVKQWQNSTPEGHSGDDCTACLMKCRTSNELNILTGPPTDKRDDAETCKDFLRQTGRHIVCGGTTAKLLARHMGQELKPMDEDIQHAAAMLTPPRFEINGIDLVAEGAVTLTQTLNLLSLYDQRQGATNVISQMLEMLHEADHVRFFVGRAENAAANDILMRQLGVRQRVAIVKKLTKELKQKEKLVTTKFF